MAEFTIAVLVGSLRKASLSRKIAQALAGGLVGWGLGLGGVDAATLPGDPAAVSVLVWVTGLVPAALVVSGGLLIRFFPGPGARR